MAKGCVWDGRSGLGRVGCKMLDGADAVLEKEWGK